MTPPATFTETDWKAEYAAIFFKRGAPPPCPDCGHTGFFGPRKAHDRLYRLCKFCGSYRTPGGQRVQCLATVHNCRDWPSVAGAQYLWWVQPHESEYRCPQCGASVRVSAFAVKRPIDDPSHPWWQVPQNMSFEEAASFWVHQGQGRVYL